LHIKSSANINSIIDLSTNKIDTIEVNFTPDRISLFPSSKAVSVLQIKALEYTDPHEYTIPIPILANISFWQTIEGTFHGEKMNFSNPESANVIKRANLTLTVNELLRLDEYLANFSNNWISPISGKWTFLAGVDAVFAPLIIRMYSEKQKENEDEKNEN
jgi:hypothetical protein